MFEVIGPVADFINAAKQVGLEWLTEDVDLNPEEEEESEYTDGVQPGETLLYVTMPSLAGLQRIIALWKRYEKGEPKPPKHEDGEWWSLFGYLSDVRTWAARDRLDHTAQSYIARMIDQYPDRPVRLELNLWFRSDPELRALAREYVDELMQTMGGSVLDFATIEPIHYQAALVDVPGAQARALQQLEGPLAHADSVMRVRPQSLYSSPTREAVEVTLAERSPPDALDPRPALAALLDGYPVQNHRLLSNRVDVKEVDVPGNVVPVTRRFHGTAMASLILHGDLGREEPPLTRALKIVPILGAPQGLHHECTPLDKLPLAMVYRAVAALVTGPNTGEPVSERVVVINHSICDQEAPFTHRPSAWAKLLDHLSYRYRVLFIVSAGNSPNAFTVDTYEDCEAFATADPIERQIVLLRSLERAKGSRLLLSPAESLNALTVGAVHSDASEGCPPGPIDPFADVGVTNLSSRVGLGLRRAIKPDLIEAGGRQLTATETDESIVSVWPREHGDVGQLTATADPHSGATDKTARSTGTSNAAALVTRSAIRIADTIEGIFEADGEDWGKSPTRAVVLKALLAHSCTWGQTGRLLDKVYPPRQRKQWQRRREAISRFLGYGRPDHERVLTGDGSRITLLADDAICSGQRHLYHIPIPRAMINNREVRRITLTLAWCSPIDPSTTRYRGVALEVVDPQGKRKFWGGVEPVIQPHPDAARRGTLQHLILEGKNIVRTVTDGGIVLCVQARADLAAFETADVPYALAVTLETAQPLRQDLFADVEARVRHKAPRVSGRIPGRVRT